MRLPTHLLLQLSLGLAACEQAHHDEPPCVRMIDDSAPSVAPRFTQTQQQPTIPKTTPKPQPKVTASGCGHPAAPGTDAVSVRCGRG